MYLNKTFKKLAKLAIFLVLVDLVFVLALSRDSLPQEKADAAIVLGAAVGTPAVRARALEGLNVYKNEKTDTVVLTGAKGVAKVSEARHMSDIIRESSSDAPKLILEEESRSTIENIGNAQKKLGTASSIVLVSDCFHLGRAFIIAKLSGFDHVYRSCPKPDYYGTENLVRYYAREIIAIPVSTLQVLLATR